MSIIRWDPFDDLASLRESMDKLFEDFFTRRPGPRPPRRRPSRPSRFPRGRSSRT